MILSDTTNILIAGGGTSQVLLPGLAVAEELRSLLPGTRIVFVGAGAASEYRQIRDRGYEYLVAGVPDELPWSQGLLHRLVGASEERRILEQVRPALVLSMGGEVGESLGRAAGRMAIPLVVFEPHVLVAPATQRLAAWADLVCLGFEESRAAVTAHCPVRVTGIPVERLEWASSDEAGLPSAAAQAGQLRRLLILGDGEHSRHLNALLPRALWDLDRHLTNWRVIHRTRADEVRAVRRLYARLGTNAVATAHIHKLPELLARADLVIALPTLVDFVNLAAAARPTVIAVDSGAVNDWVSQAAHALAERGACMVVEDVESRGAWKRVLEPLVTSVPRRRKLQLAMHAHFRRDAGWHLASMIRDFLGSTGRTRTA
jgi:UDP-N-acetylglucosamine--N-acetylmuramyl-(pentapeptide) pyrophosphoryl-undecaprenol N-acetylglucosamine transferase